ncbi:hypothetical protein QOZ95_000909 [Paenibacillus brasilensis]|uniref:Uncharacterized protein n=1 Tax=Paenibacillus brasilensis TaxID=128574 RepID=A0ABU0KXE2_9BACL|nr:hypothetical protein [Paenibacillus brasilensis]
MPKTTKRQKTADGLDDKPIELDFDGPAEERVNDYIRQITGE